MRSLFLLPLFAVLVGCGEKSSSEGSESANESAEPSGDTAKPIPAEPPSEESSETPKSLSDADVVRLLKEAVDESSLQFRNNISYQINKSKPYSGWAKKMHASGQVGSLSQFKDGKLRGLAMEWHENGRKWSEATYKDGEEVSAKYWNSDGKEIRFSEYLNHLLGVK